MIAVTSDSFVRNNIPAEISRSDQHCGSEVDHDVKNETKSDVGLSTFHNVDTTSVAHVEATSKQRCTTLYQRFFNVASMLVRTISNPFGLVMITDL